MATQVEKLSIALTPELAAEVRHAVDSGDYASTSEVVREALRDWKLRREQDSQLHAAKLAQLRQAIQDGIDSGPAGPLDIDAIKRRGRERLAALKAK